MEHNIANLVDSIKDRVNLEKHNSTQLISYGESLDKAIINMREVYDLQVKLLNTSFFEFKLKRKLKRTLREVYTHGTGRHFDDSYFNAIGYVSSMKHLSNAIDSEHIKWKQILVNKNQKAEAVFGIVEGLVESLNKSDIGLTDVDNTLQSTKLLFVLSDVDCGGYLCFFVDQVNNEIQIQEVGVFVDQITSPPFHHLVQIDGQSQLSVIDSTNLILVPDYYNCNLTTDGMETLSNDWGLSVEDLKLISDSSSVEGKWMFEETYRKDLVIRKVEIEDNPSLVVEIQDGLGRVVLKEVV